MPGEQNRDVKPNRGRRSRVGGPSRTSPHIPRSLALPKLALAFSGKVGYRGSGRCRVDKIADNTRRVIGAGAQRSSIDSDVGAIDQSIAALIDHTLLKPEASRADIEKLCGEAVLFGFASVCVN